MHALCLACLPYVTAFAWTAVEETNNKFFLLFSFFACAHGGCVGDYLPAVCTGRGGGRQEVGGWRHAAARGTQLISGNCHAHGSLAAAASATECS